MDDVRVVTIDPLADDDGLARWVAAAGEADVTEFGDRHTAFSLAEVRERARLATGTRSTFLAPVVGDEVVGAARLSLPLKDNLHLAAAELSVRPAWRRRGAGSALLREVERLARDAARTTICVESDLAPEHVDTTEAFTKRHGYVSAQVNLRSDLDMPDGDLDDLLGPLEREAAGPSSGYDVVTFWDDVPDAWAEQHALLSARMSTDAPMGDVDVQAEVWDADRVREVYRIARAQGRRVVVALAVERASGAAVGFTQLAVAAHTPDVAYQWDTLVLSEHRGHRLGQLLKAANLRALLRELPDVRRVVTWNAEDNGPMLRVNRAMGFRTVGINTEWQKLL